MRLIVSAAIIATGTVLFPGIDLAAKSDSKTAEANAPFVAQVVVVRASSACFSTSIRVTGYLVARNEAVVDLSQGDRVVEVLATTGEQVTVDQTLARVERRSLDPSKPGGAVKTETVALKAPATGVVVVSTASVGSTAFPPRPEPLFVIAVENEMDLKAEVPSIHVPLLSPGQTARVQISDTRELSGQVRLVPAAIDHSTLHTLDQPTEGSFPYGQLVFDASNNLYGTTSNGGATGAGTVFQLTAGGVLNVLQTFSGYPNDSCGPPAGLIMDASGDLFGTTNCDGAYGYGSVFELKNVSGTYVPVPLYDFTNGADGGFPYGGLVMDANGFLYGTASEGGAYRNGVIFQIMP